jgi:PAS domain S-box-containing protein
MTRGHKQKQAGDELARSHDEVTVLKREIAELKKQIEVRDIALNSAKILIRITDLNGIVQYVNSAHNTLLGYTEEERIGHSTFEVIHPDDRERALRLFGSIIANPELAENSSFEYRMRHKDGHYLWARVEGRFVRRDGKPVLTVLTVWDITERKKMEDQLHALAEKLHTIREEERTRISREIHDEFGQAMTSLKFDLALLARTIPAERKDALDKARGMMLYIDQTIQLIRRISTELRPPILDDFGLKAAIEWQACDFQAKTGIRCELRSNLKEELPLGKEQSISIFRIFQEALTNVARHAAATRVVVDFHKRQNRLTLKIKDNGRGITENGIIDKASLGITGMKERAFSRGGELDIRGMPKKGTTIQFSIPLN